MESLDRKVDHASVRIDASRLKTGDFAYYAQETGRWYVVSPSELARLCDYMDDHSEAEAYSLWCAATVSTEMPKGWEP